MIDQFTKQEFEQALPVDKNTGKPLWVELGFDHGEYTYLVEIDERTGIMVRSSVGRNGLSADAGEDSIRAWLVSWAVVELAGTAQLVTSNLGSKVSRWVTRQPGWQQRLTDTLRTLWQWRKQAGDCPKCHEPKEVFKVKKQGANKGRIFAKCGKCDNSFVWLTEAK